MMIMLVVALVVLLPLPGVVADGAGSSAGASADDGATSGFDVT